ncbi:CBS domain-containing protein, partial [Candidatus Bathyarchaeota archaeon]|nr:CBS domain-containing protein [Candidatus Bathyarchaeota archaeon]
KDTGRPEAVAAKGDRVGIVTVRSLLGVDQPQRTKVESIWEQVGVVYPGTSVLEAAEILIEKGVRAVPVVEGGEVMGIVSQVDITGAMTDVGELRGFPAKEIIQNPVVTMEAADGVAQARRLMLDKGISHIPVTKDGKLKGIVTADIIVHTFITPASKTTQGDKVGEKGTRFPGQVSGVMDTQPFTVGAEANVLQVVRGMSEKGKSACLMTDEAGAVHGIITSKELLAVIAGLREEEAIPVYILGITDEDFFERVVAEEKLRRIVAKNMKIHEGITEVSVRVKKQSTQGERVRYKLNARVMGPSVSFNTEYEGWGLMETFDGLCNALDSTLRRAKKEPQKGKRRGRRRPNPHVKP